MDMSTTMLQLALHLLLEEIFNKDLSSSFSATPKKLIERSTGSTIKLFCRVKAHNARWFREGKELEADQQPRYTLKKNGKRLIITQLQKTDAGDFICKDRRTKKTVSHFKVVVTGKRYQCFNE